MTRVLASIANGLATLAARGVPQVTAFALGVLATGLGVLFLRLQPRFAQQPIFEFLLRVADPGWWGISFFGVGIALATVAVVANERSYVLCGIAGLLLFAFALLLAIPAVSGQGTGVTAWLALVLGWICVINATSHFAPTLQHWIETHDA